MMGSSVPQLCEEDTRTYPILIFLIFSRYFARAQQKSETSLVYTHLDLANYHSHADCIKYAYADITRVGTMLYQD